MSSRDVEEKKQLKGKGLDDVEVEGSSDGWVS